MLRILSPSKQAHVQTVLGSGMLPFLSWLVWALWYNITKHRILNVQSLALSSGFRQVEARWQISPNSFQRCQCGE